MLAIICVVVAVLTAAGRADDVQLQQERLLLTNAIADRGHRVLRELENVAAAHDVVYQLHYNFDRDWVHHLVGLRLNTFFDHDHVFVTDGADHLTYALHGDASVDPGLFAPASAELSRVIDLLRGRALPNLDEYHQEPAIDSRTKLSHPRGVQRLQIFMNRPAIVAGVVAELPSLAGPISAGQPPLLMTVKFLDGQLLSDIGVRFDLPRLRAARQRSDQGRRARLCRRRQRRRGDRALCLGAEPAGRPASSAPCCRSWRSHSAASRC